MNEQSEADFRAHAVQEFPRECCGVIAIIKGRERYVPIENKAVSGKDFVMDAEQMAQVEDAGDIVAICHSHPIAAAKPSECDLVMCEATQLPWYIVHVSGDPVEAGEMICFNPSGYEAPLIGRKFYHGVLDCYSLIRDWYMREKGVELPDFEREDEWWNKGQDLYLENFASCGFEEIGFIKQLEVGDVILMQIRAKTANHAGVYIGDNMMLHHFANRLSSREIYGGWWQQCTLKIIRRKSDGNS